MIPFREFYKTNQFGFIFLTKLIKNLSIPISITLKNHIFHIELLIFLKLTIVTKLKISPIYYREKNW